eukprot:5147577-Alexandrium_andersonii.AAC.2
MVRVAVVGTEGTCMCMERLGHVQWGHIERAVGPFARAHTPVGVLPEPSGLLGCLTASSSKAPEESPATTLAWSGRLCVGSQGSESTDASSERASSEHYGFDDSSSGVMRPWPPRQDSDRSKWPAAPPPGFSWLAAGGGKAVDQSPHAAAPEGA